MNVGPRRNWTQNRGDKKPKLLELFSERVDNHASIDYRTLIVTTALVDA